MPHASEYELDDKYTLYKVQDDMLVRVFTSASLNDVTGYWTIPESDTDVLGHAFEAIERKLNAGGYGRFMSARLHGMRAALLTRIKACQDKDQPND